MHTLMLKVGDQDRPDNQNLGVKEGCIAEILPGLPTIEEQKIYACFPIMDSLVPSLRPYMNALYDYDEFGNKKSLLRAVTHVFDLPQIAQAVGDPSLLDKWRGKGEYVDLINPYGIGDIESNIKDALLTDYNKKLLIKDNNALTGGVGTYGSGGTYTNMRSLSIDLGTLVSALSIRIVGDSNDTSTAPSFTQNNNSFKMTFDSDTPHNGDQNGGHVAVRANGGDFIVINNSNANGYEFKDFTFRKSVAGGANNWFLENLIAAPGQITIHDMFFDDTTVSGSNNYLLRIRKVGPAGIIYNCGISGRWGGIEANTWGSGPGWIVENSFIEGQDIMNAGFTTTNSWASFRNVAVFNVVGASFAIGTSASGNNTISDDTNNEDADFGGGGSNNISGVTPSNEVNSESRAASDWMRPKIGGNMEDSGIVPIYAVNDMAGTLITSPYPIGGFMGALAQNIQMQGIDASMTLGDPIVFPPCAPGGGGGAKPNLRGDFQ